MAQLKKKRQKINNCFYEGQNNWSYAEKRSVLIEKENNKINQKTVNKFIIKLQLLLNIGVKPPTTDKKHRQPTGHQIRQPTADPSTVSPPTSEAHRQPSTDPLTTDSPKSPKLTHRPRTSDQQFNHSPTHRFN